MSIESFHRSLHGSCNSDHLLARLRDLMEIEEPAQALASGDEPDSAWPVWTGNAFSAVPTIA